MEQETLAVLLGNLARVTLKQHATLVCPRMQMHCTCAVCVCAPQGGRFVSGRGFGSPVSDLVWMVPSSCAGNETGFAACVPPQSNASAWDSSPAYNIYTSAAYNIMGVVCSAGTQNRAREAPGLEELPSRRGRLH
jgi:hypothetical protein